MTKAAKKPKPKKHSDKLLQPVISGNKTGGYYGRALMKHKDHKKAADAFNKMARELSDETGEVDPVKLRHHLDSGFGGMTYRMRNKRKVGQVSTWRSDLKIHHANFLKAYDPTAHAVAEGTIMADDLIEGRKLSVSDISQWIDNDEGLYNWYHSSRLGKKNFIQQNRFELEAAINRVLGNDKPAHYLAYGPDAKYPNRKYPTKESAEMADEPINEGKGWRRFKKAFRQGAMDTNNWGDMAVHSGTVMWGGGLMTGNPGVAAVGTGLQLLGGVKKAKDVIKRCRQLKRMGEDVQPILQDLIDQGFPEEELEKIINEETAMNEDRIKLLDAIVEDKPHDASDALDAILKNKLGTMLEEYKVGLVQEMFNGGFGDDEEEAVEDDDGPVEDDDELEEDEEIDLSHLTDEELQAILDGDDFDEDEEDVEEDDIDEGKAWQEFQTKTAGDVSPPKAAKEAGKALVKGAKNIIKGKK